MPQYREGFLSAYPWRYAFDATIGAREKRGYLSNVRFDVHHCLSQTTGREWYVKYYNSAIAISSPEFETLRGIAERNNVFISVGIIEKDGATLYCTAVLIGRDGTLLSSHRKVLNRMTVRRIRLIVIVDPYRSRKASLGTWSRRWPTSC